MVDLDRRSALTLGALAAAGLGAASAATAQETDERLSLYQNPVLFWNDVALELVALDHSIDPTDARAPGPCASARALGLVHAVIADAVTMVYRTNYRAQYYQGEPIFAIDSPALFVGGAAAGILAHIFKTPIHAYTIGSRHQEFQRLIGNTESKDWQAGLAFSASPDFTDKWGWDDMRSRLLPQLSTYIPKPRKHNIDPYNAGQGFYGAGWSEQEPLILARDQIAQLAPGAPPPEGSPEYERDLAEVAVLGAYESQGDSRFPARTPAQTSIGLFWAYDGARLLGTPPRLYNQIVRKIAIDDGLTTPELARLFALCNLAMADAAIVAWWAKYKYGVWRPVLGIQNHLVRSIPDWRPLGSPKTNPPRFALGPEMQVRDTAQALVGGGASILAQQLRYYEDFPSLTRRPKEEDSYGEAAFSPNFPAYPSGHASFGGACFNALKYFRAEQRETRKNPDRIDGAFVSDEMNGISIDNFQNAPRSYHRIIYKSIDDMIKDNDLSRVYLGVHWRFDCTRGSESGKRIARAIYESAYVT